MKRFAHFTVRAYWCPVSVCSHEVAGILWSRLEAAFPEALAAVLMPNHLHLLIRLRELERARWQLAMVLGNLRRSDGPAASIGWEPVLRPDAFEDPRVAARVGRYIVLNPCRARLVSDPLEWPWSTHRDVVGAIAQPWVTESVLSDALEWKSSDLRARIHGYVSGDPTVAVGGTPLPTAAEPSEIPRFCLQDVIDAAAASTRSRPADVRRRSRTRTVFIHLAWAMGWRSTRMLAQACGVDARTIRRALDAAAPPDLAAAALCLGDRRLRVVDVGHINPWADGARPEAQTSSLTGSPAGCGCA